MILPTHGSGVKPTSIESYHAHKRNGFAGQHGIILAVMRQGSLYSRRQIAKACALETGTVAARVNELLETGKLQVCGRVKCPVTGISVEGVRLVA